ncbi:hypothetical protein WMO40_13305 [Bacillaceae bacterium CLA-AA-H227]|uniref:Uncharacterized protein n=1 Tax=Robertmurraya yapensis (ex Hitch et al 2024) TaxID=3133160 RepID=A0ACC6SC68_9BACI|nr:hypothetical protein [Robertmurraya kyonggiensis]
MIRCQYGNCEKEATTKGFVMARNPKHGKDIPTKVVACNKHKKV